MTSKIVVNNIEADAGVSTVTFNSNVERGSSNLHSTGLNVNDTFVHSTGIEVGGWFNSWSSHRSYYLLW